MAKKYRKIKCRYLET